MRVCRCEEGKKPVKDRKWRVNQRNCNYSRFHGSRWQWSKYSELMCLVCEAIWRTKAKYVDQLGNVDPRKPTGVASVDEAKKYVYHCLGCDRLFPTSDRSHVCINGPTIDVEALKRRRFNVTKEES